MRKQIVKPIASTREAVAWLDLEAIAQVEVTSENEAFPVESALIPGAGDGWRAAAAGEQTLRLLFDDPQNLTHIQLLFVEQTAERFQEFLLSWFPEGGGPPIEIVRQQYNFSPGGATRELENYRVQLSGVIALELRINPDKRGSSALASLAELRLA